MRLSQLNNNAADDFFGKKIKPGHYHRVLLLFFVSTAVFAQTNGITQLPESYRTPLSDMVYDDNDQWRTPPDNPWREGQKELEIKPRFKAQFSPEYDYDTMDDPTTRSLLQNEYELERPRTNIFKYTF